MKNYYLIALLGVCLCFSCKQEVASEKSMSSISSGLKEYENDSLADFSKLSIENYKLEALQILEKGKKRLQVAVPITIDGQVNLYEETLQKFSEQAISSRSLNETTDNIIDVESEMLLQMMDDELKLNKEYYDIVFELEELNKKYTKFLESEKELVFLEDYHNLPSIVYSYDILEKITEFVNSEVSFKNGSIRSIVLQVLLYMGNGIKLIPNPAASLIGWTLVGIANGGHVVNDVVMEKQAGVPIPTTISRLNSALENPEERIKLKNELRAKLHLANEASVENQANRNISAAEYESARREFSSFGNLLKGRIGDFSDGIITQPIGHLRNLIDKNVSILGAQSLID